MNFADDLAPPMRLALAYAPKSARPGFGLLLELDDRLAKIAVAASEPLIGQLKLAWWRDAIGADTSARPKGEPMLARLSELNNAVVDDAARQLVDAWELLVVDKIWDEAATLHFAEARGRAVFGGYATIVGTSNAPVQAGVDWALGDVKARFGNRVPPMSANASLLPSARVWRPLTILALSMRDISGPRLIWHALTGR